ncbi:MAG: glycosyltransferase family 4 protein, partial [Synergistaceae bacterium]|nr:glycosyltransferase family 4 protein [Synergistaceae bacterium]MBR0079347.1 glycosyltransferase family 4 protein [Synergistaceae bacterium]
RIAGLCGKKLNIPVVSTLDGCFNLKCYKNSTHLLPCSKAVRDYEISCGVSHEKMTIIHNAVNVKFYSRNEKIRNEIRKSENLGDNKICFLGMGRFTDWKGFDVLLKGFAEFLKCQEHPQRFILWIAGDGEERENLENLAKELNINKHVKFLGFVDDVRKILWASDVYVHPSKEDEPFGLSLLQAMSAGLPVIASQSGGIPEMLNRSQGLLFPKSDVQKLSECMNEIITKINSFSELSLERAKDFDVSVIAKKVYEVYEKFI